MIMMMTRYTVDETDGQSVTEADLVGGSVYLGRKFYCVSHDKSTHS